MPIVEQVFLRHPREQDETYVEHARFAASIGSRMALGGIACLIHAVVPCLCTTSGSRTVRDLAARLADRRSGAMSRTQGARAR